jgi:hypothetical protein
MKNLLIYTGPSNKFSEEDLTLAKIQIDNSLDLGWKRQDLLLVTNFPFEYNGVKSLIVPDGLYYKFDKNANKVPVIIYLIHNHQIEKDELYWCHDFDAYELNKIYESELELYSYELGLTHYTYKPEWQFGSFFFRERAKDIFELIHATTLKKPHSSRNNEKVLTKLINVKAIDPSRYKRLNVTYNIMKKYLPIIYPLATKPLKVIHFRPSDKDPSMPESALEMFMYGKNRLQMPLMNKRLIKIFNHHEIR